MITFTEKAHSIIDSLMLLESLPNVQTSMDSTMKADIATTIANVRAWFKLFTAWMDTGIIAKDE